MRDRKKAFQEYDQYYAAFDSDAERLVAELETQYQSGEERSFYARKAENIEYLCRNCRVKLFRNVPFFFEFSSGRERYTWGGLQSPAGRFLHERVSEQWLNPYQQELSEDFEAGRIYCWNNPVGFDHFSLGYDTILEKGFSGILRDAERAYAEAEDARSKDFLAAVIRSVRALLHLAERFAQEAERLAALAETEEERTHYSRIAKNARKVPKNPPKTFLEALSAIIFCREAIASLEGIGVSIYGHLDRMLASYYETELRAGSMTYEEMKELFHLMFVYTDARFEVHRAFHETSTTIVIGGCLADGSVCYNAVTRAVLEAALEGRYVNTKVNCRISSAHPQEYFEKIAAVQAANIPILVILNDDVLIPARAKNGFSEEDARTYVNGGCHEIVLQNSEVCTRADTWINLPRLMLDAMEKSRAENFAEFWEDVLREIDSYLHKIRETKTRYEREWCRYDPMPLCSATMDGCLESARDLTEGGTKYATTALSMLAPATLADSMMTVRELVYEKKELTLSELYEHCRNDFAGAEELRGRILNTIPKYGTNQAEADRQAAKLLSDIAALCRDENGAFYQNGRGGAYLPAFYAHDMFRPLGEKTIATPDGRRAYTPLSRGCSPSEFITLENPAGVLQSLLQIDFTQFVDSFCAELTLQRTDEERGKALVEALIRVFLQNRGSSMQINFFDREMLLEARKHPEEHRDLCVRVCGYSAVFVTLSESIQNEIIRRAIR